MNISIRISRILATLNFSVITAYKSAILPLRLFFNSCFAPLGRSPVSVLFCFQQLFVPVHVTAAVREYVASLVLYQPKVPHGVDCCLLYAQREKLHVERAMPCNNRKHISIVDFQRKTLRLPSFLRYLLSLLPSWIRFLVP